ncbi:MAG TPA: metalloregulator ArsR/SmtB family transcription factor [Thermoanaerobaculia bacterium]|nr:metalloregulator ArsR/SmtB family transcription factor [Thermoanaerobaculia bacterium]
MPPSLETLFQALGDRTRLRLLNLLAGGEICVCYFVEILGEPQPKISRHLAYLRNAGLVEARRDGKWIHYRLAGPSDPSMAPLFEALCAAFASDREMARDRSALSRVCCAVKLPPSLRDAPKPALH